MSKTRHIQQRMNQRAIDQEMIDLVARFGVAKGDRITLNRKGVDACIAQLDLLRKQMLRVRDKGGLVVVESGEERITAYRLDSYQRRRRTH